MKKTSNKLNRLILSILIIILGYSSCTKTDLQVKKFPTTLEEIDASVKNTQRVGQESTSIVEGAISKAYNQDGWIDPDDIANKIALIKGVFQLFLHHSGAGVK